MLGDDSSATDKLIVTGNTSGDTGVVVNNVRGRGAQTADGIEIVHVGGQSDGNFRLQNRAVAGAWEYFLHKGNAGGTDGNWYLRSELPPDHNRSRSHNRSHTPRRINLYRRSIVRKRALILRT